MEGLIKGFRRFREAFPARGDLFHKLADVQSPHTKRHALDQSARSPPDYILFQMDQAGSLRPADEDDRERVRGRRGSPSEEKIRRRQ